MRTNLLRQRRLARPALAAALAAAGLFLGLGAPMRTSAQQARATPAAAPAGATATSGATAADAQRPRFFLVIHGGAGSVRRETMKPEQEAAYRERLTAALRAGYDVLNAGGSGVDAVVATIRVMEDSPLFNAGKGAVFTHAGTNELDSSIMDGSTLAAGAVAGVKHIRNPIEAARLVMRQSPHVMLIGEGAEVFAQSKGLKLVPQSYFFTKPAWDGLQQQLEQEKKLGKPVIGLKPPAGATPEEREAALVFNTGTKYGTVGAVALDQAGNLAAGTSTGGISNKRFGRVGDSPIIGAGTYASNASCAVSATGQGEYFIRNTAARTICARVEFLHESVEQAARTVIEQIGSQGGIGGVIVLDREGHFTTPFNTDGMFRGHIGADGQASVDMYKD